MECPVSPEASSAQIDAFSRPSLTASWLNMGCPGSPKALRVQIAMAFSPCKHDIHEQEVASCMGGVLQVGGML